eukprot:CAMPEP_0169299224 /NCGR_PEP_ID=MMETSP1016-20121227/66938_1 /TAXON_ID=342587 /ORGANISM="Karlodinium micrum, Strain CCMP2283" /LENGTH=174 /DNA_ID=CAMNT_0009391425 /DNA_START=16 /DNA_END=536 /DNA_ORIENTATION=+
MEKAVWLLSQCLLATSMRQKVHSFNTTYGRCDDTPGMVTMPTIAGGRRARGCCAEVTKKETLIADLEQDDNAIKVIENDRIFFCKAFLVWGPDRCKCGQVPKKLGWPRDAVWHNPTSWKGYSRFFGRIEFSTYGAMVAAVDKMVEPMLREWNDRKVKEKALQDKSDKEMLASMR